MMKRILYNKWIQAVLVIVLGLLVGNWLVQRTQEPAKAPESKTATQLLLSRADSMASCGKDGLNAASILTQKQRPVKNTRLLRKPHD